MPTNFPLDLNTSYYQSFSRENFAPNSNIKLSDATFFLPDISKPVYFKMETDLELTTTLPENSVTNSNLTIDNLTINNNFWLHVFTNEQYLRHSLPWTYTLIIAYCVIFIIGFIGNCMVILVVVLRPQMRNVTNMFIMNLAVADLFVIVFCLPATLLSNLFTPWLLGSVMCKGVGYVQGVSVWASAYSLAAISVDRCKAIYRPMEHARGLSKSQALVTICLIWVIALLVTLPWAVIFDVITSPPDPITYCVENWTNEQHGKIYFLVVNLFLCYSFPLILITISNVVIWCHVSNRKVPTDSDSAGNIKRMHRRTRQGVRKMLGCVTLTFLISWLPLYVIVTRLKFADVSEKEQNVLEILLPFAQWLGGWNSCINPVLYAFLNSKFREMFISLLPAWVPFVHGEKWNKGHVKSNAEMSTLVRGSLGKSYRQLSRNSTTTTKLSQRSSVSNNSSRRLRHFRDLEERGATGNTRSFRKSVVEQNPDEIANIQGPLVSQERLKQDTLVVFQPGGVLGQTCIVTDL